MSTLARNPSNERSMLAHVLNRRRFLSLLGGAGVAGVVGCSDSDWHRAQNTNAAAAASGAESLPALSSASELRRRRPVDANRRLVVIEMAGGNDGLAMLQPYEDGVLRDRRTELMSADEDLIDAGNGFGWHPALAGLAKIGVAGVVGVGSNEPDFSHFEMEQRWWRGVSEDNSGIGTGFFGRVCDVLDVGDPVTGLSFSGGPSAALASEKAVTVGITDPGASWFFSEDEPWYDMLRTAYGAMSVPSVNDSAQLAAARGGLADTLRFAASLSEIPQNDDTLYPWTDLGQQLRFASEVLDLEVGVRVMHVRQDGFDTHSGQQWRHRELMSELNDATVAFVNDLDERGQLDNTMIVTTSEFGRRVATNEGGTDHGGASSMMVCGPSSRSTGGAIYGEAPNLTKLDDDNLVATSRFEDYYATIAEDWFDIAAGDVLPTGGTPITGLV
jgi:uncharacterized protein (DUF1501 family)